MKFIENYKLFESTKIKELNLKYVGTLKNNLQNIVSSDFDEYYYVYAIGRAMDDYVTHSIFLSNTSKLNPIKYSLVSNDTSLKDKVRMLYKELGHEPDGAMAKLFILKVTDFINCEKIDNFVIYNSSSFFETGSLSDMFIKSKLYQRLKERLIKMIQHEITGQNKRKEPEIFDINPAFFKEDKMWDFYIRNNNIAFKQYYDKFSDKMKTKYAHLGVKFGFFD